jgi:hypothetical protein
MRREDMQVPSSCFQVWDRKDLEGIHPSHQPMSGLSQFKNWKNM